MGFWDGSGIRWTIRKQSAPRSRQITTSTRHHSSFTAGCSSWRPTSSEGKRCQQKASRKTPVPGCVHERRYIHTRTHRQTTQKHNAHVLGGYGTITPVNMAFAGNVTQWHSSLSVVYFALISVSSLSLSAYCKTLWFGCPKSWWIHMQIYFGIFYCGESKLHRSNS